MRVRVEQILRLIVIASLVAMLWQSLRSATDSAGGAIRTRGIDRGTLAKWSALANPPSRIRVQLTDMPSSVERAWLGALAATGSSLTWSGDLSPVMIDAQPLASPMGRTNIVVAAPNGSSLVVSDDVGTIDTVRIQNAGATFALNSTVDHVTARVKGVAASAVLRDSAAPRRILVIGDASWESKFVVAALEEEGWKVDPVIRVAPAVEVTQGSGTAVDTARYSAVIALDSSASAYTSRIIAFVRSGGGVILEPQAASLAGMSALRASVAVPMQDKHGTGSIQARRIGAGRALQIGSDDSWRMRMTGGDNGVADHRRWWTGLVSNVAYAPRMARATADTTSDNAPMAALVAAIGPGSSASTFANLSEAPSNWMAWLFVLLALGLIAEVASRRTRGAA